MYTEYLLRFIRNDYFMDFFFVYVMYVHSYIFITFGINKCYFLENMIEINNNRKINFSYFYENTDLVM